MTRYCYYNYYYYERICLLAQHAESSIILAYHVPVWTLIPGMQKQVPSPHWAKGASHTQYIHVEDT